MTTTIQWPEAISHQKRELITQLILQNIESDEDRDQWLDELETATAYDGEEIMANLLENIAPKL